MARHKGRYCKYGHDKLETGAYSDNRCKKCHQVYLKGWRIRKDITAKQREERRLLRLVMQEALAKEQQPKVQVTWG